MGKLSKNMNMSNKHLVKQQSTSKREKNKQFFSRYFMVGNVNGYHNVKVRICNTAETVD